jgi:hypothetical protein
MTAGLKSKRIFMAVGWNFDRIIFMTAGLKSKRIFMAVGLEIKKNIYDRQIEIKKNIYGSRFGNK